METLTTSARRESGEPLPVLVLTGFLGAGKTTVLNRLLVDAQGLQIAAIVNDFGELDIDAQHVAGRVDSVMSLSNGCMCCEVDSSEITDALVQLADPQLQLDLVVIEASGVAEPFALSRMVHEVPPDQVSYAGLIQVVDADNFSDTLDRHPRLGSHLALADLVVVNKCDLVRETDYHHIVDRIRQRAPRVAIISAVRGAIPVGLLLGLESKRSVSAQRRHVPVGHTIELTESSNHHAAHEHLHAAYQSFVIRPAQALHPRRTLAAFSSPPPGMYRVKGSLTLANTDDARSYEVAMVGRRLEFRAVDTTAVGLVVIGVDMPDTAPHFLDNAVVQPGEHITDADVMCLHPYLVADNDAVEIEDWIYDDDRSAPSPSYVHMLADPEDPDTGDPAFTP